MVEVDLAIASYMHNQHTCPSKVVLSLKDMQSGP